MSVPRVVHCRREPYDVYIGRPSKWGNPFKIEPGRTREVAVQAFRDWMARPENESLRKVARQELRGKVLGCWCAPEACHGDVLLEIANAEGGR